MSDISGTMVLKRRIAQLEAELVAVKQERDNLDGWLTQSRRVSDQYEHERARFLGERDAAITLLDKMGEALKSGHNLIWHWRCGKSRTDALAGMGDHHVTCVGHECDCGLEEWMVWRGAVLAEWAKQKGERP